MSINVSWEQFKNYITSILNKNIQCIEDSDKYEIFILNSSFCLRCVLPKDGGADVIDFENNYKANCNRGLTTQSLPFSDKILQDGSRIFRRVRGISGTIDSSTVNIDFTVPFLKCKITGVQILGAQLGDKATFQILDTEAGTISGVPNMVLNTFGENVYIAKDFAEYPSKYDADLIQGLVLRIVYTPKEYSSPTSVYINFDLHQVV